MANTERQEKPKPYGLSRVLDEKPCLPGSAKKLDNQLPIYQNEILIDVNCLNLDAASFVQMEKEFEGNSEKIGQTVLQNCQERGKQQNKVTGSGGMLVGKVLQVGSQYPNPLGIKVGDRVATLVSLVVTPMHLEKILEVNLKTHQVKVKGHAILFHPSPIAKLPEDLPESVALAAFDVAGAPGLAKNEALAGKTHLIVGAGGKAGILCCAAIRSVVGKNATLLGVEPSHRNAMELEALGYCDKILEIDATDPVAMCDGVNRITHGKMADRIINVTPAPGTEVATVLAANATARVVFFGMATSFSSVTLGAEALAAEATLLFGNGFVPGHGELTLSLLRNDKKLLELFQKRYL